jgi:hypothetical protein
MPLSEQQMVKLVKEMQTGFAGVDLAASTLSHRNKGFDEVKQMVLQKNSVPSEDFEITYKHYQSEPALMDTLLAQVITALQKDLDSTRKSFRPSPPNKIVRP